MIGSIRIGGYEYGFIDGMAGEDRLGNVLLMRLPSTALDWDGQCVADFAVVARRFAAMGWAMCCYFCCCCCAIHSARCVGLCNVLLFLLLCH